MVNFQLAFFPLNKNIKLLLGYPVIMSSYNFNRNNDAQGPPSDSNGNTNNVPINS
jgi:hypothetical protein